MPHEIVVVLSTLCGTLVGGFINYFSTRSMKDREWRLSLARDQISLRRTLYADFLVETQRLVLEAIEEKIKSPTELNTMNGKFAEITLVASEPVVTTARQLADYALSSHCSGDVDLPRNFYELKGQFIEAARCDIELIQRSCLN